MRVTHLIFAALLSLPGAVLACDALGPNAHVGPVLSIDKQAQSFTLLDAQTRAPVTFRADDALLERVEQAEGRIIVDFEREGSTLRAQDIRY